ncbi:hypothetical protein GPALN_008002 [Globodera pallida]|nr:hypothetical protein GPALN_008002 [Globodera pallida]
MFFSSYPMAFLALVSVFFSFYAEVGSSETDASKKFAKCCSNFGIFSPAAVKSMCHYPPNDGKIPELGVREEISLNLDKYIGCYAANTNNTQCCYDKGVKGEMYDTCRDFCCGGPEPCPHHTNPQKDYYACISKVKEIASCNAAAWDNQK